MSISKQTTLEHRAFVARPIVATIAVVVHGNDVLLVRRANSPDAGRWGFPGGKIEMGESLMACTVRELHEETGVRAETIRVLTAVDAFDRDADGSSRQHFVLVAVLCRFVAGEPIAGDDALDARWFAIDTLGNADLALSLDVARVARMARHSFPKAAQ